jgi:exodeoxyribonuclease VII large subunit
LERGYAVVQRADGSLLRDPGEVTDRELLSVRVAGGRLPVRVDLGADQHATTQEDEQA